MAVNSEAYGEALDTIKDLQAQVDAFKALIKEWRNSPAIEDRQGCVIGCEVTWQDFEQALKAKG